MESKLNFIATTQGGARPSRPQQAASGSVTEQQKYMRMQQLLFLLLHADSCQRVSQNSGETSQCRMPTCKTMRGVLNHVMSCQAGKNCAVPQCSYSRQILDHWNNCNKKDCPVCQPVKRFRQNKQVHATPRHAAPPAVDVRRAYAAYQQALCTFPTTRSISVIPRSPLANRQPMLSPMVLFQTDVIQHSQLVGDGSMSGAKDFLQSIPADTRNYMVHKVVCALFRPKDPTDPGLVAYARKIEGEVYAMASTPFEYYDLLDEKVYKIQKEMKKKRQKRKKQISKL